MQGWNNWNLIMKTGLEGWSFQNWDMIHRISERQHRVSEIKKVLVYST
jgi:hypothetical protein